MQIDELVNKIEGLAIDSRKVKNNYAFAAIKGINFNGENFINSACNNGASVIISENSSLVIPENIHHVVVDDIRKFISQINAKLSENKIPEQIFAITGTNGKSSVVHICNEFCRLFKVKSASIGTLGAIDENGKQIFTSNLTTPNNSEIHEMLRNFKTIGIENVFIEASSIGIDQHRISNISFMATVFTNFSQDHLDYHKNMEEYFLAKLKLFSEYESQLSIIKYDDEKSSDIIEICKNKKRPIITYGRNGDIDLKSTHYKMGKQNITFAYEEKKFTTETSLVGDFQAENILSAIAIILKLGFKIEDIVEKIPKIKDIPGRLEKISDHDIYVDYAHTPDALKRALKSLRKICQNKLIVLFGCGGNRDVEKRTIMGNIANEYADLIIVTSDNPRFEKPLKIINEIVQNHLFISEENRAKAIEIACSKMEKGDVLLVAGKGHENYQIIGDKTLYFNDRETIEELFKCSKD